MNIPTTMTWGAGERSPPKKPALPARMLFLLAFHAAVSGAFVVAWFSGDEDTYLIHQLAGYLALAAVTTRLAVAGFVPKGPLAFPRPSRAAVAIWLRQVASGDRGALMRRGPLPAWMAASLLALVALTALSGVGADSWVWLEGPHEFIANLTLWVVLAHVAFFAAMAGLKRLTRANIEWGPERGRYPK